MVYADNLLNYPDWTINFSLHTDVSDKKLVDFICRNNKPIEFFSRIFREKKCNSTMIEKEIL